MFLKVPPTSEVLVKNAQRRPHTELTTGVSGVAPGGLHFHKRSQVILMHTEVSELHYFHCLGYFPGYFKQLALSEKQITLYQVISLHEPPKTNISYLATASSINKGTPSPLCSGRSGRPGRAWSSSVTVCFILGHQHWADTA